MTDRVALFRSDTAGSADALARLLDGWPGPPTTAGPVRFVGYGSSRFAALTVAARLSADGRVARVDFPSALVPALPGETVFAISASGRTPEVLEAARRLASEGATVIAVTNDRRSALATAAARCIELRAGTEASGIASRTYRATIAALALAAKAATADEIQPAVPLLRSVLHDQADWLDIATDALDGVPRIDVVAGALSLGTAEQTALMLREGPRLPATAWEAGEWLHSAIYTALPGHRVVIVAGTAHAGELGEVVTGRGGRVLQLTPLADGLVDAMVASVVAEELAARLWARAAT